jgi:hypothetical protein
MKPHVTALLLPGLLLLGACGESAKRESCEGLAGHYDLQLRPAVGELVYDFSLSLDEADGKCTASVTPEGYPTVSLVPELTADALILDDTSGPELPTLTTGWYWGLHFYREYHFSRVALQRSANGDFAGAATSTVEVTWAEDDICSLDELEWSGTLGPDVTSPTLRAGGVSVRAPKRPSADCFSPTGGNARPGFPDQLVPWEVLAVEASEPIANLSKKLDLTLQGKSLNVAFADATLDEHGTAKDVWVATTLSDWDLVRGKQLSIVPAEGLSDAAGNPLTPGALAVSFLDVGPALAAHELDDSTSLATFGGVTQEQGVLRVSAPCNSGEGGIAGRLLTSGATKVSLRVRMDAGTHILVAVTGTSGTRYDLRPPTVDIEWHDIPISISNEDEVGFSIVPNSLCHWTSAATVWVDRVWSE